ncbi:MAG TPA: cell envelope integrity protein CreD [Thermoanaerobaculia bacterium]|nr:cell envelope integrity protein CreD [Thermoanaerobaculia bacterium]
MSTDEDPNSPATPKGGKLRYPAIVELLILGGLVVVLVVGLALIRSLVSERSQRAANVRAEIASSWGQRQTVGGPVLIVPFRARYVDSYGKHHVLTERARFLPDRLKTRGLLQPEARHRGIYATVLYSADLRVEATFARPDFSAWNVPPEDILWSEAVVTMGITDLRGIRGNPAFKWGGNPLALSGGSGDAKLWTSGLSAPVPLATDAPAGTQYPFSFDLKLNGSEEIRFLPLGGETVVELTSSWPDPSFSGAYLPEARAVAANGFTARWSISSVARSYPQRWRDTGEESVNALNAVPPSSFGVGLFSPISHYQKTERSMKYGALFIVLTFLTFFLYELLSPVTLHPVQYFLVGGALSLFYLLLLSLSEHTSFATAYAIASTATVVLISSYSAALLGSPMRVLGLFGVLALLYGYLYVLLQLEDWALLMGSLGLFLILALVMYTTRRVDWGAAHVGRRREVEAAP